MGTWNPGPGATEDADTFTGDATNETADGLGGNDTLNGGDGNDTLTGGAGNDFIRPGYGIDTALGGEGDDVVVAGGFFFMNSAGENAFLPGENWEGGAGVDRIDLSFAFTATVPGGVRISGPLDLRPVSFSGFEVLSFTPVTTGAAQTKRAILSFEQLGSGLALDATIFGSDAIDVLELVAPAGGGSFTVPSFQIWNWSSADHFDISVDDAAGAEAYWLTGSVVSDHLGGGAGGDVLQGLRGNDELSGGDGDDFLFGDGLTPMGLDGNDRLIGGAGADYMDGGDGVNTASYLASFGGPAGLPGFTIFLANNSLNTGHAAGDIYFNIQNLVGTAFSDILGGTDSNNQIDGSSGDDWLFGNPGDDVLQGGLGNDLLHGEAGADALDGQDGDDVASYRYASAGVAASLLSGGSGGEAAGDSFVNVENIWASDFDDDVAGDDGNNQVYGFAGDDILAGNGGDDDFYGAEGGDSITGGLDADDFYFLTPDQGGDQIADYNAGQGDRLMFSQYWFGIILPGFQTLPTANFVSGNDPVAASAVPTFLWDADGFALSFDADGNGAGGAVSIATFQSGVSLTAGDIWMA